MTVSSAGFEYVKFLCW